MKLILTVLFLSISNAIVYGFPLSLREGRDIVSTGICRNLCKGGQVFTPFLPPKESDCSSSISCKKCDYSTIIMKSDPSAVCSYVFSNEFVNSDFETQLTLFHGRSQLIIPHNSTLSRLSKESNVLYTNKGEKNHGLFTVAVEWKKMKGADISQCSNGIAEIEWSIFNIGVYRNWDIVAIIETKPEATFPFCFENVEFPLDATRSSKLGSRIPTNLKRLGYSIANGRPSAIRITKTIAVNQKEMKINPEKALETLLKKYVSFKISINGASVKKIFLETFHESRKDLPKDNNKIGSNLDITESSKFDSNNSCSGNNSENSNKLLNKKNIKLEKLKEKLIDKLKGKGFTDPLILDSMMSLGFYSCFRVICTKKKFRVSKRKPKLEERVPLTLESARNAHSKALDQFSNLIPRYQTVPLPIYNSEYWVNGDYKTHIYNQSSLRNKNKIRPTKGEKNIQRNFKNNIEEDTDDIESDFSSNSDLLTIIALTNSETLQSGVNVNEILEADSLLGSERDN
ncbi:signal peptide protein [Cryptosporidium sp. chipmunk genotype I]|uniref:signal peptide protein n=1 Tax=Cryptosporidium sp. chipmunk genotype I TaxID=1280935 RepID=UPI00351A26B3|nr:signal peptide protein [Cryptosporidium sp. chipmunk genotype I]